MKNTKKINNDSYLRLIDGTVLAFNSRNTPIHRFTDEYCIKSTAYKINGQKVVKDEITEIHFGESYNATTIIGNRFLYNCSNITAIDLSGLRNVTTFGRNYMDMG